MTTNSELTRRIAGAVHVLRPEWPTASILTFISRELAEYPRQDLAVALVACAIARDDSGGWLAETPRYVLDGDWLADSPNARADWAAKEQARQERDERLSQIRIRNQAIARCHWCNDEGRLDNGHVCHHDRPPTELARQAASRAAKARSKIRRPPIPNDAEVSA